MTGKQNENEPLRIEAEVTGITDEAWIIVHAGPEGLRPQDSNVEGQTINAHAFGPYFSIEEVESWLASPDRCLKFVMPIRAVRSMAAGPLNPPPSMSTKFPEVTKVDLGPDSKN